MRIKVLHKFIIVVSLLFCTLFSYSQNKVNIDSLKNALSIQKEDTNKVNTLVALCWEYSRSDIDKANGYVKKALSLSEKLNYKLGKTRSIIHIGILNYFQGNYDSALVYYNQGLDLSTSIKDTKLMVKCLVNMGLVNAEQGRPEEALKFYFRALTISEKAKDYKGIGGALGNVGNIYYHQNNFDKALDCFENAIANYTKINDMCGIANNTVSAAVVYKEKKNYKKALELNAKVVEIFKEQNDKNGLARTYNNIGVIYDALKDLESAKSYYMQGLALQEEINDKRGACLSMDNIALIYAEQKQYQQAAIYFDKSLKIAKEIGGLQEQSYIYKDMSEMYRDQKDFENAYKNFELFKAVTDSILNIETTGRINELNTQYQTEKKETENKLLLSENKLSNETIKQQKLISYFIIGGLVIVSLLAFFIFRGLKRQRTANVIISEQKYVVEQQRDLVEQQKHLIEEKHKEITDSINYAERIQRSFIATKQLLDENLKEYFVLFKPKDVVSGDFYWAAKLHNDKFALVTADSTGHGVPGAIMSLLNVTSLEKAIESYILPSDILNSTRKTIIERLKKDGSAEGGKDGMDASLCLYDFKNKKLTIAAANNPVWIMRKNESGVTEAIEVKPDKMPIGKHDKQDVSFTQQEFDLQSGDVVYALTDGFPDQFGGPKGKKFMSKNLRELLVENAHLPMLQQKQLLETTFADWVGNMEQVDDVTLIGVRV